MYRMVITQIIRIFEMLKNIQIQMKAFEIITLLLLIPACLTQQPSKVQIISLNDNWQLEILSNPRQKSDIVNKRLHTMIPSTLHLDLLKHEIIEDPFIKDNYYKMKWVSDCVVKYTKRWNIQDIQKLRGRAVEIVFHGIDTYANVSLNGNHLFHASNAFRTYRARIDQYLFTSATQQNVLQVIIQPASLMQTKSQQTSSMPYPYAHTRKPAFQYSTQENPQLVTMGIWKNVQLLVFDEVKIDYVWVRNKMITDSKAELNFAIQLNFNLFKSQKLTSGYSIQVRVNQSVLGEKTVTEEVLYLGVNIFNPTFWWPNGVGDPYIYNFTVNLLYKKQILQSKAIPYGIRTAELNLQNKQFQLKINGYPIYCKGANYLPMDMFSPRLSNKYFSSQKPYTSEQLLQEAADSNFNMLRIWGGGQYQSEQFLQSASRKGIMIFYDFMFSNTNYPATSEFFENVQEEVKQQIRKARNYPAVVLWNGNNQVKQKMELRNWNDSKHVRDYQLLFENLLQTIIDIQNPFVSYIPSSPIYGDNTNYFEVGGDAHYWGIWSGVEKIENYANVVSPFTSAFGTESLPVLHTIRQFTRQNDTIDSKGIQSHQKRFSKLTLHNKNLQQYFPKAKNFEAQVYFSGLLQAYAVSMAIVEQRSSKPKSYGTLFWHLNDVWPAVSYSSIDYYGRWKPLQYGTKNLYSSIGIFTLRNNSIVVVNDKLVDVEVYVNIWVGKFDGTSVFKQQKSINVSANSVQQITKIDPSLIKNKQSQLVSVTEIHHNKILQMRATKYFTSPKLLKLPKQKITVTYNDKSNQIKIESKKLIKNLFIDDKTQYLHLTDNYFDVIPGFPVTVQILRGGIWSEVKDRVKFMSLRDAGSNDNKIEELEVVFS